MEVPVPHDPQGVYGAQPHVQGPKVLEDGLAVAVIDPAGRISMWSPRRKR